MTDRKLDKIMNKIYHDNCSGIQIDVMDMYKVFEVGRAAYAKTNSIDECAKALIAFVETIRKN